eukprot:TRINITY_DN436_c0_g2_i1.p1 TRINITY_DN436_c0_g2~~TRINITY_DN436_c0_g2_i1.p1  ORF type:complete len:324 (-),score=59.35 TRINITY_DN436_c0_g2_i1:18-878(-)
MQEWRKAGQYTVYQNKGIFFIDKITQSKSNRTIMLFHGFPTSSFDYAEVWDGLEKEFSRIITFDYLGYGFSDKPFNHTYHIMEQADIAEFLLKQLGVQKFHIMTHDVGVSIVQELLARNNPNIIDICFLNGGLVPSVYRPVFLQKLLLNPYIGPLITRVINYNIFRNRIMEVFGRKPQESMIQDLWDTVIFNNGNYIYHKLMQYQTQREENAERWVSALKNATTRLPIMLINGPADPVSGRHLAEYYQKHISDKNVVFLDDDIGHFPHLEAPEIVLKHYLSFVNKK